MQVKNVLFILTRIIPVWWRQVEKTWFACGHFRRTVFGLNELQPSDRRHGRSLQVQNVSAWAERSHIGKSICIWGVDDSASTCNFGASTKPEPLEKFAGKNNAPQSGDIWEWIQTLFCQVHQLPAAELTLPIPTTIPSEFVPKRLLMVKHFHSPRQQIIAGAVRPQQGTTPSNMVWLFGGGVASRFSAFSQGLLLLP